MTARHSNRPRRHTVVAPICNDSTIPRSCGGHTSLAGLHREGTGQCRHWIIGPHGQQPRHETRNTENVGFLCIQCSITIKCTYACMRPFCRKWCMIGCTKQVCEVKCWFREDQKNAPYRGYAHSLSRAKTANYSSCGKQVQQIPGWKETFGRSRGTRLIQAREFVWGFGDVASGILVTGHWARHTGAIP